MKIKAVQTVLATVLLGVCLVAHAQSRLYGAQSDRSDVSEVTASASRTSRISSSSDDPTVPAANKVVVNGPVTATVTANRPKWGGYLRPFSAVAVGVKVSSLGVGFDIATPLTRSLNLRGGASFFDLGVPFGVDGVNYTGQVHFRSGQIGVDWFPFRWGFHITPGVLIYHSQLAALASVPGGTSFDLGNSTFTSSVSDPVHGSATLSFQHTVMPSLMMGFGNLIPRSGRHWSIPFEVGVAYMGHNQVQFQLQGTACQGQVCQSTGDPTIQQDVLTEQNNLNEDLKRLQIYPIVSTGFGYRF